MLLYVRVFIFYLVLSVIVLIGIERKQKEEIEKKKKEIEKKKEMERIEQLKRSIEEAQHPVSFDYDDFDETLELKIDLNNLEDHYRKYPGGFDILKFFQRLKKKIYYEAELDDVS